MDRVSVSGTTTLGQLKGMIADLPSVAAARDRMLLCPSTPPGSSPFAGDNAALTTLGLGNGAIVLLRLTAPAKKRPAPGSAGAGSEKPAKKRASAAKGGGANKPQANPTPAKHTPSTWAPDNVQKNGAAGVARAIMIGSADKATAEAAHDTMSAAERVEAVAKCLVTATALTGTKYRVAFGKRKKAEAIKRFAEAELVDVTASLFSKVATARRRNTATAVKMLSLREIARRHPPFFWSVYLLAADRRAGAQQDQDAATGGPEQHDKGSSSLESDMSGVIERLVEPHL